MLESRWTSWLIVVGVGLLLWVIGAIRHWREIMDAALWSAIALSSHAWMCKVARTKRRTEDA